MECTYWGNLKYFSSPTQDALEIVRANLFGELVDEIGVANVVQERRHVFVVLFGEGSFIFVVFPNSLNPRVADIFYQ